MTANRRLSSVLVLAAFLLASCARNEVVDGLADPPTTTTTIEAMTTTTEATTTPTTPKQVLTGTVVVSGEAPGTYLVSGEFPAGQQNCGGHGPYEDITLGAKVLVTDESGDTLGETTLSIGVVEAVGGVRESCIFQFEVELIREALLYAFEIVGPFGIDGRQGPTFTHDEMIETDWVVSLVAD